MFSKSTQLLAAIAASQQVFADKTAVLDALNAPEACKNDEKKSEKIYQGWTTHCKGEDFVAAIENNGGQAAVIVDDRCRLLLDATCPGDKVFYNDGKPIPNNPKERFLCFKGASINGWRSYRNKNFVWNGDDETPDLKFTCEDPPTEPPKGPCELSDQPFVFKFNKDFKIKPKLIENVANRAVVQVTIPLFKLKKKIQNLGLQTELGTNGFTVATKLKDFWSEKFGCSNDEEKCAIGVRFGHDEKKLSISPSGQWLSFTSGPLDKDTFLNQKYFNFHLSFHYKSDADLVGEFSGAISNFFEDAKIVVGKEFVDTCCLDDPDNGSFGEYDDNGDLIDVATQAVKDKCAAGPIKPLFDYAKETAYNLGYTAGTDTCIPPQYENWSADADVANFGQVDDQARVYLPAQGFFQGQVRDNVMAFNGIRFATSPTGVLRFRHSLPPAPHKGVFQATKELSQVPGCIAFGGDNVSNGDYESEDCLFMNIVTPKKEQLDQLGDRPVIVFVHGGNWRRQTGADNLYNGHKLASEEGAIVVTFNMRNGPLGYLKVSAALDAAPGNQAMSDCIQALRWVKQNIAAFGGDPNNVTLMGQSSGSDVVASLLAVNPNHQVASENLFQRAIIQSNPWGVPERTASFTGDQVPGSADTISGELMTRTGCIAQGAGNPLLTMQCMLQLSPDALEAASEQILAHTEVLNLAEYLQGLADPIVRASTNISPWAVTYDPNDASALFTQPALQAYRNGDILDVPLMIGATSADGLTFMYGMIAGHPQLSAYNDASAIMSQTFFGAGLGAVAREDAATLMEATHPLIMGGAYKFYANPCIDSGTGDLVEGFCDSRITLGMLLGDYVFRCPMYGAVAKYLEKAQLQERASNTFMYMFDAPQRSSLEALPLIELCKNFACHSSDTAYWFGSFDKDNWNFDEDSDDYKYSP